MHQSLESQPTALIHRKYWHTYVDYDDDSINPCLPHFPVDFARTTTVTFRPLPPQNGSATSLGKGV